MVQINFGSVDVSAAKANKFREYVIRKFGHQITDDEGAIVENPTNAQVLALVQRHTLDFWRNVYRSERAEDLKDGDDDGLDN